MTKPIVKSEADKKAIAKIKEEETGKANAIANASCSSESNKSYCDVKKLDGTLVRTYTLETHGKEFRNYAKMFAKKNAYVADCK